MARDALTEQDAIQITGEAERLLQSLADAQGVKIKLLGGRLDTPRTMEMRFSVEVPEPEDAPLSPQADAFIQHAHLFGLSPADLGRRFELIETPDKQPRTVEIIGMELDGEGHPILLRSVDTGRLWRMPGRRLLYYLHADEGTRRLDGRP